MDILQPHISSNTITNKLRKILMEKHQLKCKSKHNYFSMDPKHWSKLLTKTRLKNTWIDIYYYGTIFEIVYNVLPTPNENDMYIMDQYF